MPATIWAVSVVGVDAKGNDPTAAGLYRVNSTAENPGWINPHDRSERYAPDDPADNLEWHSQRFDLSAHWECRLDEDEAGNKVETTAFISFSWTSGWSSLPPASSSNTLIFAFCERRAAKTQPAEPAPITI